MTKAKKPTDEQPNGATETQTQADPAPADVVRPHKGGSFVRQGDGTLKKQKKD